MPSRSHRAEGYYCNGFHSVGIAHQNAMMIALSWIVLTLLMATIATMAAVVRPWDGKVGREHRVCQSAPYPVFWLASWIYGTAEWIAAMKPGPVRVAEIANSYLKAQVLFGLVSLGVPGTLVSGPKTAAEVAELIGPTTNIQWLDRLLSAAAVLGMLHRTKVNRSTAQKPTAAEAQAAGTDVSAVRDQHQQIKAAGQTMPTGAAGLCRTPAWMYSLNAVSAALVPDSSVNMSHLVRLCEQQYNICGQLAQGIRTNTIPCELHTGGQGFWDWINNDPERAANFDLAMVAVNHFGGTAAVNMYCWHQYDCVIDIAGGVGGFMADLLRRVPRLKGVVLDNIQRAQQLWSSSHPELLPRVQLVAGDMFDAASIPSPPNSSSCAAYVLRNILHDWPDADCVNILRAIRSSVEKARGATDNSSHHHRVVLLILELTTDEGLLPCNLPYRHASDLVMLMSFGDAQERNRQQFQDLLHASGWRLCGIKPTSGVFMVVEAEPA